MRDKLLFIHRWLGLTAGVVFTIASFTGAILVLPALGVDFLRSEPWVTTPGTVDAAELAGAVASAYPTARVVGWAFPSERSPIHVVRLEDEGHRRTVFLDPGSGRSLARPQDPIVVRITRRLHTQLLAGPIGRRLLLYSCIATLMSLALGLVLWWPGVRRLWQGFRVRLRRGAYILSFDLHQSAGVLALPLLLIMTGTAVVLPLPSIHQRIDALRGTDAEEITMARSRVPPGPAPELLSLPEVVTRARASGADRVRTIDFGDAPGAAIVVDMDTADGRVRLALDRYSGDVLALVPDGRPTLPFGQLVQMLHVGRGAPVPIQLLYLFACLVGAGLLPTGAIVWWMKRTRRRGSAARRPRDAGSDAALPS